MNKTKKLTQGAMMLAIFGALILIDRMIAYAFTELVVLTAPIIIIMYSAMQSFKDGLLLSIGVMIIAFLLGNFQLMYLIFIPVGVITGIAYSYGLQKGLNKTTLLFIACATYIVGEVAAEYIVYPLLGFPVEQMIEEFKVALNTTTSMSGMSIDDVFGIAGVNFDNIIVIVYLLATILTGLLEGVLIHILVIFLLKRFKIKDLGRINLWDAKPNKVVSYISFLSLFSFFFKDKIANETVFNILMTIAILGGFILIYYGYLFVTIYGAVVMRRNLGAIIVILGIFIPVVFMVLMILGFLYGAGPLRKYLEGKVSNIPHE